MSRRNRSSRRRTYGKRQHEVHERRPEDASDSDRRRDGGWVAPELIDDVAHRDDGGYDALEGWAR